MSERIPEASCIAFFHGEEWYECPHCKCKFEVWDTDFERRGIKKTKEQGVFICGQCKKKFKIV